MKSKLLLLPAIILSLTLQMAGCGGITTVPDVGDKAPNFTMETTDGKSLSLSDFRGRSILIVFTSVNCKACEEQMPYIEAVYKESSGKLAVLNVYMFNTAPVVRDYISKKQFTSFPALPDPKGRVATQYGVAKFPPINIFIDAQGIIRNKKIGPFQSKEEIEKILETF